MVVWGCRVGWGKRVWCEAGAGLRRCMSDPCVALLLPLRPPSPAEPPLLAAPAPTHLLCPFSARDLLLPLPCP